MSNDNRVFVRTYANAIAAGVAGCTTVVAGFPFDSIKTRMQTYSYNSFLDCFRQTVRNEGLAGLFRGLLSPMLGFTTGRVLSFSVYDNSKKFILKNFDLPMGAQASNVTASFLGGALAGMAVSVLSTPLELVKIQRQLQELVHMENAAQVSLHDWKEPPGHSRSVNFSRINFEKPQVIQGSTLQTAKQIYQQRGWLGFYFGYHLQLPREIFGTSVYFGVYECVKCAFSQFLVDKSGKLAVPDSVIFFLSGGFSGVLTWSVMFPLDLVKSKIQKNLFLETTSGSKMKTIKDCVAKVYKQRGYLGFYSGFSATVIRALPVHSLNWIIYEKVRQYCLL